MIRLLLIALLPLVLNASKILSYNIYDRTDRADVMITFDTPYEGVIKQSVSNSIITIKLIDANIESFKTKKLSSKFLHSISITPMSGYTQIVASVAPSVELQASKTSDAYGLRLRFHLSTPTPSTKTKTPVPSNNPLALLPTKQDSGMSQSYYIVIAILIIGILILIYLKKKMAPKESKTNKWTYNSSTQNNTQMQRTSKGDENVSIRFQKNIDSSSSVVMLDFGEQSYLVLMGSNNILLDKFTDDKPSTQDEFESILRNRQEDLDKLINPKKEAKEPLQAYKERAASISYEA
ncbi:hypothetical protein M947_00895 [Sulfurimonas hongkongensis]|uniref:Uncharacterized protein n=1 Tax=Sulfurimonas hongkongensis TaxID=1172190 RepID=T0JQF7_9BACT|nr:hypothetical protein [Sulfurimonas hongkongensis]EQB40386.1 hypothetical protein M947_00895 [Sulfurimonas hongkongensis]